MVKVAGDTHPLMIHYLMQSKCYKNNHRGRFYCDLTVKPGEIITARFTISFALEAYTGRTD